ncbi:hypothetical protein F383_13114 [Gossypium arboreum]|uniref:Uncharacterized protein n=1 Tax=Gossypium arboreum TaxID=29729 RepID=A0A0B0PVF2_GOSAR|nr:hypothetical protein F383_13114 [Gossypium arboreum]
MSGTWQWHFIVCMIILNILSIPSGSTGSPRICQRNDVYRQASSGIKVRRRHIHTIDWIIWV